MSISAFAWYANMVAAPLSLLAIALAVTLLARKFRNLGLTVSSTCFFAACLSSLVSMLAPIQMTVSSELTAEQQAANDLSWQILAIAGPIASCTMLAGSLLLIPFALRLTLPRRSV